jgi:proteasome beta subunit
LFADRYDGPSFYELLTNEYPYLLPTFNIAENELNSIPKGTTILALKCEKGVVIGGDRMAIEGYQVASRKIEKVYKTDEYSAIAIAGATGPCLEMVRLLKTEFEHYEKIEGVKLSIDGKANKLAQMVRNNLPLAIKGLIVIPIFVGYDVKKGEGRIFKYDITGGRYEETEYYATGSGGKDARNTLKKFYKANMPEDDAVKLALSALYDASEEDLGTGGPDILRGIYPTIKTITKEGIKDLENKKIDMFYKELFKSIKRGE